MTKKDYFEWVEHILDNYTLPEFAVAIWNEVYTLQQCMTNYGYWTREDWAEKLKEILVNKNSDYTAEWASPFYNFELYGLVWVTTEQWIKTRMIDKISRIKGLIHNWNNSGRVKDESLADSWLDLWGYMVNLLVYQIKEQTDGETTKHTWSN